MLRAGLWKKRGSPYVCDLCQHKLSVATRPSPCRASTRLPELRTLPSSMPSTISTLPTSDRAFSTTRAPRNSSSDNPPPKIGGFTGSPGAVFGSFGTKKPPSSGASVTDGALLPHEREARQRSSKPPPAKPPTSAKPNKPQRQQYEQSRSALAELFSQKRDRPQSTAADSRSQRPNNGSRTTTASALEDSSEQGLPAWGAFSKRKTTTQIERQSRSAKETDRQGSVSGGGGKHETEGRFASGAAKDGIWDEMTRNRRSNVAAAPAKPAQSGSDDFWGELETRVSGWKEKDRTIEAGQPKQPKQPSQPSVSQQASQPTKRRSRFDYDDSVRDDRGRKPKQNERRGRQQVRYDEDEEWDDEEIERWEAKQRRLEEKRLRQQQKLAEEEPAAVPIFLPEFISVSSLAQSLKQPLANFSHDLEEMGFENITNDTILTGETAALIAMEYGFEPTVDTGSTRDLRPRPVPEDPSALPSRPPIVTIMGHVDHGKTTLLDWLRKSSVAAQEHGGITQHIGAFVVQMSSGKRITFLDTPGHAAFLSMRQRGANVTDIVILVVAADDSVKPQTVEALKHATAAKVPIIVAINKVDKEEARVEQVKADLARHGVEIEDYGGDVQVVCVSGKTGLGMEDLEENIVTLSEILDVRSEADGMAEGWVLESSVKQNGKVATVLIKRGTLRPGDFIVAGRAWARVRSLQNEAGVEVDEAPPGTPVEILGWRDLPEAGEQVLQAPDEDKAKTAVDYRQEMADRLESSVYLAEQEQRQRDKAAADAAAAEAQAAEAEAEGDVAVADAPPGVTIQNYTVRADVAGSVEAVCGTIQELGNNEVQPRVLRSNTGQISEYDIDHASASRSIIINFNSPVQPHIKWRAEQAGVRIIDHSVIYHLVDEVRNTLSDLLPMTVSHRVIGEADVLQVFPINIKKRVFKNIAGCRIRNGNIKRTSLVKVLRKGEVIFDGKIDTLKHVKKDVMEMGKGSECGVGFDGWQDLRVDDQIQTYEILKERRYL